MSIILFIIILKIFRWGGTKFNELYDLLFNPDEGKVVQLFATQTDFINSVKVNSENVRGDVLATLEAIKNIEKRLAHMGRLGFENMNSEYFNVLFEKSPVPIAFVDIDGKFISSNYKACELLGYSTEELQQLTFIDVTALGDVASDKAKAEKVKHGEIEYYRMEKTYVRKNGSTVYCALHVYRIPKDGPFNHYIAIMVPLSGEFAVR